MPDPLENFNLAICDAAPDAVIIADDEGTIRYVNTLAEAMFAASRGVLVGAKVESLMAEHVREQHVTHRSAYRRGAAPRPMGIGLRLQGVRSTGEPFPVEISLSPIVGADGSHLVMAAVRDVSDRERAERELRTVQADLAMAEERDRIARDLHDTVIQQLFAIGMTLQSLDVPPGSSASARSPESSGTVEFAERLEWAIDELDRTIREVRSVIFGLQAPRGAGGLRAQIVYLAHEARRTLGFEPRVQFSGLVDTLVPDRVAEQVVLAAREALANVVRHAAATDVSISVKVGGGRVGLVVADNGLGISVDAAPGHGLRNLDERAAALNGVCRVDSVHRGGTTVTWDVPLG